MHKRYLLFLAIPLLLGACASDQDLADQAAVERSGVSPAIYDKMVHDDALSVSDVAALSRARVNDGVVLRYMRDHDTVYVLSHEEIDYLQRNGVSPSIIDYMVQTGQGAYGGPGPGFYPPVSIGIGVGGGYYGGGHWR